MSQAEQAEAARLREVALHQAAHDCRGSMEATEVVKRAKVYRSFLAGEDAASLSDGQIKHMVERFLGWRLPHNFNPDGGITFEQVANKGTEFAIKREPSGANLLDLTQAAAMVRYITQGLPAT